MLFLRGMPSPSLALSQITENRKVWTRKSLIFRYTIFGFFLEEAILRQSPRASPAVARHTGPGGHRPLVADSVMLSAAPRDTLRAMARHASRSRQSPRACQGWPAPDCRP